MDGDVVVDLLGPDGRIAMAKPDDADAHSRTLAPVDVRHPIFQAFGAGAATLGLVTFDQVSRVEGAGCATLARFTSGEPALLDCPIGEGRALVFASDLGGLWNDFPRRATFVPFLREAVRYLAAGRRLGSSFLVSDRPAGVPAEPGMATVPAAGGGSRLVAVNVDPRESDVARLSADEFLSVVTHVPPTTPAVEVAAAREQEGRQRLWQYALGLMLVALAVESFVAARSA